MGNEKEIVKDKIMLPLQEYEVMNNDTFYDDRFKKVKIFIAHAGENLNYTSFSRESLVRLTQSLAYVPIVGCVKESEDSLYDFSGHEERIIIQNDGIEFQYLGVPFGFIPEEHNARIEIREGKEWLVAEGYLWSKFNQSIEIFENSNGRKSQSMEIEDIVGYVDDEGLLHIEDAIFSALCILGDDIAPAMAGSTIEFFSKDSKDSKFKRYMKEMILEFSQRGDDKVTVKDFEQNPQEELEKDNIEETPEEEVNAEQEAKNKKASEDEKTPNQDKAKEEDSEKDSGEEGPVVAHKPDGSGDLGGDADTVPNLGPEGTGGRTDVGTTGTEADTAGTAGFEAEIQKYQEEIKNLKVELEELKQFKLNVEQDEKKEILNSYEQELSKKDLETLEKGMANYSVEEFEKEVAYTIFKREKEAETNTARAFSYSFDKKNEENGQFGTLNKYFK